MKSILDDFRAGTARERLAIVSDLFSIVGVSLIAVIAPILSSRGPTDINDLAGISILALLSLTGFSLALAGVIVGHGWLRHSVIGNPVAFLVLSGYWSAVLAGFVYATTALYYFLISIRW